MCGFFKSNCLGLQQFFPTDSIPIAANGDLSSWHWNPGLGGLGLLLPDVPPKFYPPQVDVGPAHSVSAPLLPVWMDVVPLIL